MPFVVTKEMANQGVLWIMFLAFLLVGIPALWTLGKAWLRESRARSNALDIERRQREKERDDERRLLNDRLLVLTEKSTQQGATQTEVMRLAATHIERGNVAHDRFVDLVTRLMDQLSNDSKATTQRLEIMHGELRQVLQLQQSEVRMGEAQKARAKKQGHRPGGAVGGVRPAVVK